MKRLTLKQAKRELRALGYTINRQHGEYRVNLLGGEEVSAYYTTDISDAVGTARAMSMPHYDYVETAMGQTVVLSRPIRVF
jgi:hypothetical protein